MADTERFEYESIQDPDTIREHISAILDGIEKRRIVLDSNGDEIVLTPAELLDLSIRAKKKGALSKLSIRITWKQTEPDPGDDDLAVS